MRLSLTVAPAERDPLVGVGEAVLGHSLAVEVAEVCERLPAAQVLESGVRPVCHGRDRAGACVVAPVVAMFDGKHQCLRLREPLRRDRAVLTVDDSGSGEGGALAANAYEDGGIGSGDPEGVVHVVRLVPGCSRRGVSCV